MINNKILNTAKKYSLKKYSIKIDGPIYYLDTPYWIISYQRKKFFIKSFLEKMLIVDENGVLVNDQEIFKKVSIFSFVPYPSKAHIEIFKMEFNELEYVYNFFTREPTIIGRINLNILDKKFEELNYLEPLELIKKIKNQNNDIANVLSELVNVRKNIINIMEKLLNKKDSLLLEKFYEEILDNERPLFQKIKSLIDERIILIRKIREICKKYSEEIVKEKKDKKLLIKNFNDEIVALFRFNSYINNKLRVYEMVLKRLNEIKQQINEFYLKAT